MADPTPTPNPVADLFTSKGRPISSRAAAETLPSSEVWWVASGVVELFLVGARDGNEVSRSFLRTAESGQILHGLDPLEEGGVSYFVLPLPGPGTKVLSLPLQDFAAALQERPGDFAGFLDELVTRLQQAALPGPPPILAHQLQCPGTVDAPSGGSFCPPRRLVWVAATAGSFQYLGEGAVRRAGDPPLPLGCGAWIVAAPGTTLQCLPTDQALARPTVVDDLTRFQREILSVLVQRRQEEAAAMEARIAGMVQADAEAREEAWTELAGAFRPHAGAVPAATQTGEDPLLAACRLVGEHVGQAVHAAPARPGRDQLSEIARASRMRARRVALKDEWWKQDGGPMVGRLQEGDHPVALIPPRPGAYDLVDPADGKRVRVDSRVAATLKPVAAMFYLRLPARPVKMKEVFQVALADSGRDLWMLVMMGAAMGLLALAVPVATNFLFEEILPSGQQLGLEAMVKGLIVVALATTAFALARSVALLRFGGRFDSNAATAMYDRILTLPMPFYSKYTIGDLAQRSLGITQVKEIVAGGTLDQVVTSTFAIFSYALLFVYEAKLALLATVLLALNLVFLTWNGFRQLHMQRMIADLSGEVNGVLFQILSALPKIRVAGAESRFFGYWAAVFSRQMDVQYRSGRLSVALAVFNSAFPVLSTLLLFGAVGLLRDVTTGSMMAFLAAYGQCVAGIAGLSQSATDVAGALPQLERTRPILDAVPEVDESKSDPGDLTGAVEITGATYRYRPDDPPVLDEVTLKVEAREFVALVGPTGAGKTTTLSLLLGFDFPESGSVFYDGKDLRTLDLQAVRQQVGVVLQDGRIFKDSVFRNIVGARPLTLDDAWEAVRMVGLEDDVKRMPMGMDTVVSEETFSGGQAQRLLIARAIVSRPRIIYFDEATSALDNETQAIVSRSLESLNATRLVIAHRLSTIQAADRIYVFSRGRIVQQGNFKELAAQDGLFKQLVERQMVQ